MASKSDSAARHRTHRMVETDTFLEMLRNDFVPLGKEHGRSARVYMHKTMEPMPRPHLTRQNKRKRLSVNKVERLVLKAQICVWYKDAWMSVQIMEHELDDGETPETLRARQQIIESIFNGSVKAHEHNFNTLCELTTHDFEGEVEALVDASRVDATPPVRDVFYARTDCDRVRIGVFIQHYSRTLEHEAGEEGVVKYMAQERTWRALVAQMRVLAAHGLAHLDLNPGNLVVTRGLPRPVQVIDLANALRPSDHLPVHKECSKAERAELGNQWRMTIMAQHLMRMWNVPAMRRDSVFMESLLPRMRELVHSEQDKCDALLARHVVPGQSLAEFYNVTLYE
jgi:hypothetical protein